MNKSFLIIFIPVLLVGAGYLALGVRPPARVEIGIAVLVAAFAAYRIRVMVQRGKTAERNALPPPSAPNP